MFIKKVTNRKAGKIYMTYRLVKSKRVEGIPRHIHVLDLGSIPELPVEKHKDLAKRIDQLINNQLDIFSPADLGSEVEQQAHYFYRKLIKKRLDAQADETEETNEGQGKELALVDLNSFASVDSKQIGGEWLCSQAFEQLGLAGFFSDHLGFNTNQVALCLLSLTGRMLHPASERNTAVWLNENSAALELNSPRSGKVDRNRLTGATLWLYRNKDAIEDYISGKVDDIFGLEDNYFLYDLTNTHFEGSGMGCEKAKYGRNKQKRNDCRQITLGLLTDSSGLPKRSRYYDGNIGENTTFSAVLDELEKGAKDKRPVIVADAGIATENNLKMALKRGFDYICVSRSAHRDLIEQVSEEKARIFINKSKQQVKAQFFDSELIYDGQGQQRSHKERILYIEAQPKKNKEKAMIGKKRQRFETGMATIAESLQKPRADKTVSKINQRIGRLKERCKGIGEEYGIDITEQNGQVLTVAWNYNPDNAAEHKAGNYFIRTSIEAEQEELLWKLYRTLGEIESAFKTLKSDLNMRPIFHRKGENMEAHLNLAVLAYFIVSFIRHRLKQNNITHRWLEITRIMSTQKYTVNTLVDNMGKTIVFKTCMRAQQKVAAIYQGMKYKPVPFFTKKVYLDS